MEEEIGRCYILRRKGIKAGEEVLIEMTFKGTTAFTAGASSLKAPSEEGYYTLIEELNVHLNHIDWKWLKEGKEGS